MPSLILTKWDAENDICVPAGIVSNLQNYHLVGVRFLYDCYRNKLKGGVLNHEVDMNLPAQVSAFLTALKKEIQMESPTLIICSENRILKWLYHLKMYGGFTIHLSEDDNSENINEEIILASIHQTKALQNLSEKNLSFIIVEEFDLVSNKRIFKQLRGNFHVGLTTRNFINEPAQKTFFEIVNWTNPGVLGKFSQFCKDDTEHIQNFRWPYEKYWHRLTWSFCDTFKRPTVEEKKEYDERIQLWAKQEKIELHSSKHTNNVMKRKYSKIKPKQEQEEMQTNSLMSSDSSNDVVKALDRKTSIRKKKKVTPNKHVKGKSGKYVKVEDDNEINFRTFKGVELDLVPNNFDLELNSDKKSSKLCSQSTNANGDLVHSSSENLESQFNSLKHQKVKRKRNLPLLSSSSSSSSDEDNSILLSLLKPGKPEEKSDYSVNKTEMTQTELDLFTMLDQSVEEFEKSLEGSHSNEDSDVLLSIISTKKNTLGDSKKLDYFEIKKSENDAVKTNEKKFDMEILSSSSDDSDFFEKLQLKTLKNEFKEHILSLLSDDCDI